MPHDTALPPYTSIFLDPVQEFMHYATAKADLSGYTMERLLFRRRSLEAAVKELGHWGIAAHNNLLACHSMLAQTVEEIDVHKRRRWVALNHALPI